MLHYLHGENGIILKAQTAKNENLLASAQERLKLKIGEIITYNNGKATLIDLNELLNTSSTIYDASIDLEKVIVIGDSEAKLTLDGYTFTVNSSLNIISSAIATLDPFQENLILYSSFDNATTVEDKVSLKALQAVASNSTTLVDKNAKVGNKFVQFLATETANRLIEENAQLNFGTSDFTIEFWANADTQVASYPAFCSDNNNSHLQFFVSDASAGNNISLSIGSSNTRVINTGVNYTSSIGKWVHYAVVRKDGVFTIYQDGLKIGETSLYKSVNINLSNLSVGANYASTTSYKGSLDDFSIYSKAKYTVNFTPQTINTDNQNRVVYIDFEDSFDNIYEEITNTAYSAIGNMHDTKIEKKFGMRSIYFPENSTGNRIKTANSKLNFGTKDFTIEFWANPETQVTNYPAFCSDENNSQLQFFVTDPSAGNNISLVIGSSNIRAINTGVNYTSSIGKWVHYAVVRKDGVFTIYQDGKNIGTTDLYKTTDINLTQISIGGNSEPITAYKGYIDDFAVYNSAKYTTEFTPANKALK